MKITSLFVIRKRAPSIEESNLSNVISSNNEQVNKQGNKALKIENYFIFCRVLTFISYIEVNFMLRLLDCARYNEDFVIPKFVISRFCSIHFTVTLAGLENIIRYTKDFVI